MPSLDYYSETDRIVLNGKLDDLERVSHAIWASVVQLYFNSNGWTLHCLQEREGQWDLSRRLVDFAETTTLGDLFAPKGLPAVTEQAKTEDPFYIAITRSGLSIPKVSDETKYVLVLTQGLGNFMAHVVQPNPGNRETARALLNAFSTVWQGFCSGSLDAGRRVNELNLINWTDMKSYERFNKQTLTKKNESFHQVVMAHAKSRPFASAVCAWDGSLTYQKLDEYSNKIANFLRLMGVREGDFIPSVMEKSFWNTVVLIGILKAGGVYVPMDPKMPPTRINSILMQISAKAYFTNLPPKSRRKINPAVYCIKNMQEIAMQPSNRKFVPVNRPSGLATCFFTSGSTGTPKGVMHDHAAICTGAVDLLGPMHMDEETRCLQFVSPSFDVSVSEIFATLYAGGCVCIPSEAGRLNDLNKEIQALEATHAFLTPSVASQLKPEHAPSLKYLMLGGEPMDRDTLQGLCDKVNLINTWGMTESSLWDTATEPLHMDSNPSNIGPTTGARMWIVHPDNHNTLLPFGAVGEVMVESYGVALGYIGQQQGKPRFVAPPQWRQQMLGNQEYGRLYLTGDLGYYNADGSICLHGRKDTQSKLRGQRIELGEVEHHLRQALPSVDVVAEVVEIGPDARKTLAAFVAPPAGRGDNAASQAVVLDESAITFVQNTRAAVTAALSKAAPIYMVPEIFIPINRIPLTISGKTDRKILRQLAPTISESKISALQGVDDNDKVSPTNEREQRLQSVWASVLGVDAGGIGIHDHFLRIGGNSILAMKVAAAASDHGMAITVADLLQHPTIASLSVRLAA